MAVEWRPTWKPKGPPKLTPGTFTWDRAMVRRAQERFLAELLASGDSADRWKLTLDKMWEQAEAGDPVARQQLMPYLMGKPGQEITVTHDSSDGLNPSEARRLLELLEAQQAQVIEGEAASGRQDGRP